MTELLGEHKAVVDDGDHLDDFPDAVVCGNGRSHAPSLAAKIGIPVYAITNSEKIRNTERPLQEWHHG
jgi:hypothetical protein